VAYAHSRGVVHRDLKPSNVMLGLFGETLVVDWGLAKCFGRNGPACDERENSLDPLLTAEIEATKTGTISGTPTFMSPEQAEASPSRIGPATDVYSLGATLYAILAGKVPFEGKNPHVILRKLKEGELTAPRTINSSVPRPLEAVCLKAMARHPEDRYESPRALADDLERWLADEPVSAWREPASERARRLMRRHRVWVLASAVTLVTVSVGLSVSLAAVGAKNIALDRERRRAEANATFLLQGLTEALKRLANPALRRDLECRESALAALREGEAIYLDVMDSERRFGSPPSHISAYWIHVALLRTAAGDREGTLEAYCKALDEALAEVRGHPDHPDAWAGVGGVRTHLGLDLWVRGSLADARGQLCLATEDFRRALDLGPNDAKIQQPAAWLHVFCPDPQIRDERLALELSQRFVKQDSGEGRDRPRFSVGIRPLFTLALAQYRTGDWQAARLTIEQSIRKKAAKQGGTTLEKLVETRAVIDAYDWFLWSMTLARQGESVSAHARFEDAAQWMRRNRFGDFELHLLHDEAASLLGVSIPDLISVGDDAPAAVES
jgi:eukaryotic-like serine/threonine-protein kinase